ALTLGEYTITGIKPGTFRIREVGQAGWTCSFPNAGAADADGQGVVTSSTCFYAETFTSGGAAKTARDFGNWTTSSASGMKFNDQDADGVKDSGEPGLGGWVVYVDYNNNGVKDAGEPFDTTSSAALTLGEYTITGIKPGTFRIREVGQAGWTCSFPNAGAADADGQGVVTSSTCFYAETFTSGGAAKTARDFGNWTTSSAS